MLPGFDEFCCLCMTYNPATTILELYPTEMYIYERTPGNIYKVCSSFVCKSPKLETTHISISGRMDNLIMIQAYWILYRNENKWTIIICSNMNES